MRKITGFAVPYGRPNTYNETLGPHALADVLRRGLPICVNHEKTIKVGEVISFRDKYDGLYFEGEVYNYVPEYLSVVAREAHKLGLLDPTQFFNTLSINHTPWATRFKQSPVGRLLNSCTNLQQVREVLKKHFKSREHCISNCDFSDSPRSIRDLLFKDGEYPKVTFNKGDIKQFEEISIVESPAYPDTWFKIH